MKQLTLNNFLPLNQYLKFTASKIPIQHTATIQHHTQKNNGNLFRKKMQFPRFFSAEVLK